MGKFVIILLLAFSVPPFFNEKLVGNWKLREVKTQAQTLYPTEGEFTLEIVSADSVKYNRDVNRCWASIKKMTSDSIYINTAACTKIGEQDPISDILNYSGKYEVNDSILMISNHKGIFVLERLK